jgi:hypothetical protein
MKNLKDSHMVFGLAGLAIFVLSGMYMHLVHHHLQQMAVALRLLSRPYARAAIYSSVLALLIHAVATAGRTSDPDEN